MSNNYGLNVLGTVRVFRKDKEINGKGNKKYIVKNVWYNVSEKNEDGTYTNISMNLIFKRDIAIPDNNKVIEIQHAFPVITGTDEYRKIALCVCEWNYKE